MPFYEYECSSCGHSVEALQKVSDPPLKKCPNCGKSKLAKLISAPVFRLKGAGWYETDFKSDTENKRNLAEHPEAKDSAAKPAEADAKATETKEVAKPAETKVEVPVARKDAAKSTFTPTKKAVAKSTKAKKVSRPKTPVRKKVARR